MQTGQAEQPRSFEILAKDQDTLKDPTTKRALSAPRRQLLELMQRYNFCRIENLEVRDGEPAFNPEPRVRQEIKIGAENGPRPELQKDDFLLKAPVIELFEHLNRVGNGRVAVIEVKHGLPFKLTVEQPVSPEGA